MILATKILSSEKNDMKTRKINLIILCMVVILSCREEDKKFVSIVGKWKGTLAEVQIKPFGLPTPFSKTDESFAAEIEFRSDGKLILMENGQLTEGTYQVIEEKLITDIDFNTRIMDLSGTYTIEELTGTKLVFYLKKNDTLTDPDSGLSVSGNIKGTLHFQRL